LATPHHFSNRTFVNATEVIEDVSSATVRTRSISTRLTSKIDRTARLEAIATSGNTSSPGIWTYAAAGMIPISAVPSFKARAQAEGRV